ncbi:transcription factor mef2A-like isoform X2 [Cydia pomonella]|uniref:transcription factor mef2A-like isoform X2 n=1 Tax=Cydia pomonella TaxID=82600 RepID=UPI002ADE896F|nr:transcription factor mef2A-like isoform X2 [Cydia pomonella]
MKEENEELVVHSERYSLMEDQDWRTRGGSIWNHTQERAATRVKCRATTCQLVQLVKFMEKHPELAVSHAKPFPGSDELWMELAAHINQFGPPKNYKQCKTTWRDLRKRAFAMQRSRNKKGTGRNLYGMAPKIVSLITQAGMAPKYKKEDEEGGASSSRPETPPPVREPLPEPVPGPAADDVNLDKTKGEQLVIRVTDNMNSKRNVFNTFTINDGHFENIIVKEERLEGGYQPEEQEMEPTEAEVDEPHDQEEMFPQPEAILGGMDEVMEEKNSVIRDLNDTLRKFLAEYKTRNALMRERIDLERARLQFDMEVYRSRQMEKRVIAVNTANAANVMNTASAANVINANAANVMNAASTANIMKANTAVTTNAKNVGNVSNVNTITVGNAGNVKNANVVTVNAANAGNTAKATKSHKVVSAGNTSNVITVTATSSNAANTSKANPMITVNPTNTANTGNANNNRPSNPVMTLNPFKAGKSGNAGISVEIKNTSIENASNVVANSPNASHVKNLVNANIESAAKIVDDVNTKTEDAMDET